MNDSTASSSAPHGARMRAARANGYGRPDVVSVEDVPVPVPADDQLLVRVKAASVNRADLDGLGPRPGFLRPFLGLRAPRNKRVGIDVAGVVESVGAGVTRFKPGDEVFGDLFTVGGGSFAEYALARERVLQPIPAGMAFDEAATLPHSAILAIQGLRLRNGRTPQAGDRVLVDGASGNVGPFAVQVAKALGTEVTGVCRTEKMEFVRSVGADHVIDYTAVDYTKAGKRYDWIVDTDTHHSVFRVRHALRPNGVYVTLGGGSGAIVSGLLAGLIASRLSDKWMGLMLWWKPFHADDVTALTALIAAGKVRPMIDRRYPLDAVADALRWVDEGHAKGKVIVTM